jgi:phosphoglycolate phosphatase (TIGR01487 family)
LLWGNVSTTVHRVSISGRERGNAAIAVDFDGTITTGGEPPKAPLVEALRRLKNLGVKVILATGRCAPAVYERVDRTLFDALVAENGAVVIVNGAKTSFAPAGWDLVRRELFMYFEAGCEEVIVSADSRSLGLAKEVVRTLSARIELNKDRIMIMPPGIDKGTGLTAALSRLGLRGVETTCVGDGENDVPMFEVAGVRVALKNSVDVLKRRADFIAGDEDGDGTLEAITKLFRSTLTGSEPHGGRW